MSDPDPSPPAAAAPPLVLGGFRGLVAPGVDSDFQYGGFPLPDGSFWRYREPDATVVVEHDKLRVSCMPLTRSHDRVQILDNAKNMYFSRRRVLVSEDGIVSVEAAMSARIHQGRDDDLYSGFVSLHLLDFTTGIALDWFVANRRSATVYARLRFPGMDAAGAEEAERPHWFCLFHEFAGPTAPGEEHPYAIVYDRGADTVRFLVDGEQADSYPEVPVKMDSFVIALGMMTEKPIGEKGSVSCFGQGITAQWSEVTVRGSAGLS